MSRARDTNGGGKRSARRPEGPAHARKGGVSQTGKRLLQEFSEDGLTDWAAALTYYGLLSMFPALIALVAVVGYVFNPQQIIDALTSLISQIGPSTAIDTFRGPIEQVAADKGSAGILAIVGIAGALWSASGYTGGFMRASNVIYEVEEGRPIWKLRPLQMVVTLIMVLLLALAAMAVVVSGPLASWRSAARSVSAAPRSPSGTSPSGLSSRSW